MSYNLDTDLFPAATGLVGDQGLSSLSLRAVASRMGVSASSLVYRFQSREGLLCWLLERLVSADAAAWQRRREEILHLSLTRAEIQAIARAVMTEQVLVHKAVCTGLWEFELASHSNAKFREYISLWRHNDIGFWERCFAQVGLDEKLAPSWASGLLAQSYAVLGLRARVCRCLWLEFWHSSGRKTL